jgi:hypothetical protein
LPQLPENLPAEYKGRIGRITVEKTLPHIRTFIEEGGTVLALDTAATLAYHFGLPLTNALVEKTTDGREVPLRLEKLYVPGSVLRARVDNTHPLAHGLPETLDVFFDNTPSFALLPDAGLKGVVPVAWFETGKLLRSGWPGANRTADGPGRRRRRRERKAFPLRTGDRFPRPASRDVQVPVQRDRLRPGRNRRSQIIRVTFTLIRQKSSGPS